MRSNRNCIDGPHVHCDVCDTAIECENDKEGEPEPVVPAVDIVGYYWKEVVNVESTVVVTLCAEHALPIMEHLAHVLPTPPPPAHTLN